MLNNERSLKYGSMAEGGEEEKENPFSYMNYIQSKKTKDNQPEKEDDFDIFDMPDNSNQRKRDKQRQQLVVEDDVKPDVKSKQKKKGKSENPFSFKKFLSTSSGGGGVKPGTTSASNTSSRGQPNVSGPLQPGLSPVVTSDLPDFVQDHFTEAVNRSPRGLELPDFTFIGSHGSSTRSSGPGESPSPQVLDADLGLSIADNQDNDSSDELVHVDSTSPLSLRTGSTAQQLPDFLSDGAISSNSLLGSHKSGSFTDSDSIAVVEVNGDLELEVRRLRDENQQMKQTVSELRKTHREDTASMTELRKQLEVLKKKEADETAFMEKAIQQVEENLSTTTKRAVHAETVVTKLKQEVRALQGEVKTLRSENELLRSGDKGLADIKERTQYVSQQLSSAAATADNSIRQLLSGVENLKMLSQVLTSIDKISEEEATHKPGQEEHRNVDDT